MAVMMIVIMILMMMMMMMMTMRMTILNDDDTFSRRLDFVFINIVIKNLLYIYI